MEWPIDAPPSGSRSPLIRGLTILLAPVLLELAVDIMGVTEPDGTIVLAGLIETQVDRVLAAFCDCRCVAVTEDGNWRSLILRR
jgi:ribosomal protein L11 methyltransferase